MKKKTALSLGIILFLLSSCTVLKVGLTQELLDQYITAYTALKKADIVIHTEQMLEESRTAMEQAGRIVIEKGFKSYLHFIRVHTKIVKGLIILESQREVDALVAKHAPDMEDWQKKLNDPEVTDERKKEIREKISRLLEQYSKNEEYNNPVKVLSRWIISQEALILIEKNEDKLRSVIQTTDLDTVRQG